MVEETVAVVFKRTKQKNELYYLEAFEIVEGKERLTNTGEVVFIVDENYIKENLYGNNSEFFKSLAANPQLKFMSDCGSLNSEYVYASKMDKNFIKKIIEENYIASNADYTKIEGDSNNLELSIEIFKEYYLKSLQRYTFSQMLKNKNKTSKLMTFYARNESFVEEMETSKIQEGILYDELGLLISKEKEQTTFKELPKSINVKQLASQCKEYIIGQDDHIGPILCAVNDNLCAKTSEEKTNILVCGETGTGKTAILKFISENSGLPIVIEDATQFSIAGYVGRDVTDIFEDLLQKADNDLELAQRGIVVIDEIDKKASGQDERVSGVGVLQSMFKFLEGGEYTYEVGRGFEARIKKFNTMNTTFVFSGAFSGLEYYKPKQLGFDKKDDENVHETFSVENLKKFGVPPEFTGRLHLIEKFEPLSEETLKKILKKAKRNALDTLKIRLKRYNTDLVYNEEFIDAVAREAYKRKTNARGLFSVIRDATKMAEYEVQCDPETSKELILTSECLTDPKNYKLIKK